MKPQVSRPLIILNHKTYYSYDAERAWHAAAQHTLQQLSGQVQLIICPELIATAAIAKQYANTNIMIAGQFCSPYSSGSHTGAVLATSLAEAGCKAVLIGHQEHRRNGMSDLMIARAVLRAFEAKLVPIIGIGEQHKLITVEETIKELTQQLIPLREALQTTSDDVEQHSLIIAYEPSWAINGSLAHELLRPIYSWLSDWLTEELPQNVGSFQLVYGGGITTASEAQQALAAGYAGIMLGRASSDVSTISAIAQALTTTER